MYNQLFQTKPSNELIFTCLKCLGFDDLNDHRVIPRSEMETNGAVQKFYTIIPKLFEIYIPCKFDLFCMKQLDISSCITITKQLLKTIEYDIVGKECVVNGQRMQKYEIMTVYAKKIRKKVIVPEHKKLPVVVSFK